MTGRVQQLPVELLAEVFGWLGAEDLESASGACRLWCDVINCHLLQRRGSAVVRPGFPPSDLPQPLLKLSAIGLDRFDVLQPVCSEVQDLLIGYDEPPDSPIDLSDLSEILEASESLESITFKYIIIDEAVMRTIIRNAKPDLKSVTIHISDSFVDEYSERVFGACFAEFRCIRRRKDEAELNARYSFPYKTMDNIFVPKYVSSLKIDCHGMSKAAFDSLKFCDKLKELELCNTFNLEDEVVTSLVSLKGLKTLNVSDAERVTAEAWSAVFGCERLVDVALARCAGLTDRVFLGAIAAGVRLDLDLEGCKGVTGDGLFSVVRLPTHLSLRLDYSEEMVDGLLQGLTTYVKPRLKKLDVSLQRFHDTTSLATQKINRIKNRLLEYLSKYLIACSFNETFINAQSPYFYT